jgi:hydrogenase maturation protease
MAEFAKNRTRVLCLGNDLLADDGFGLLVGAKLRPLIKDSADVVTSTESGIRLLDHLLGASRVVVIDVIQTHGEAPGTVHCMTMDDLCTVSGPSPHYIGLSETLALGRRLGLPVADELVVIAVEASDCVTVGGPVHPDVSAAIPHVVGIVKGLIA